MHLIGQFYLLISAGIFLSTVLDAALSRRWKGVQSPWVYRTEQIKKHEGPVGNSGSNEHLVRTRRNREKIPLMIGKGSKIVSNQTKVHALLSDLKVACRTTEDCSDYLQSQCLDSQICNCTSLNKVFVPSQRSCVKPAALNASCSFLEQCTHTDIFSECEPTKKTCLCIESYFLKDFPEIGYSCITKSHTQGENQIDPTMITVLVALGLMFVIICVVLRLFSKARFRENRSIFNTPNPRLMNASLFKDSKLLSPARGARRGSTAHGPCRTASICSVNKEAPRNPTNGSLNKGTSLELLLSEME